MSSSTLTDVPTTTTTSGGGPGLTAERLSLLQLSRIARSVARSFRWREIAGFDEHERWYDRLVATDAYEAWLLTWLPGQATGPHDHGRSSGAMLVLSGCVAETTYAGVGARGATRASTRTLPEGTLRPFGAHHLHDVAATAAPAVTLHVYAPALRTMTSYEWQGERLLPALTTRAGADW